MGKWRYSSNILNPRHYMEMCNQLHAPAALPQESSWWYPLYMKLRGSHSRSGRYGKYKNIFPYRESEPDSPLVQCTRRGSFSNTVS
jgi:hypothetical protein